MILKSVFMLHAASSIIILFAATTSYATSAQTGGVASRQQRKAEALSASNSATSSALTRPVRFGEKIGKAEVLAATATTPPATSIQYPRGVAASKTKQELPTNKRTKSDRKNIANKIQSRGRRSRGEERNPIETSQLENLYETNHPNPRGSKRADVVGRGDSVAREIIQQHDIPVVQKNGYEYQSSVTPQQTMGQAEEEHEPRVLNRSRSFYTNLTHFNNNQVTNQALNYLPQQTQQQQPPQRSAEKLNSQHYADNKALEIKSRNIPTATIENNVNSNRSSSNNSNFFNNNAQTSFINKYKTSLQNVAGGGGANNRNQHRQNTATQNIPTIAATPSLSSLQRERIQSQSRTSNRNPVRNGSTARPRNTSPTTRPRNSPTTTRPRNTPPTNRPRNTPSMTNQNNRNSIPTPIRRSSTNIVTTSPLTTTRSPLQFSFPNSFNIFNPEFWQFLNPIAATSSSRRSTAPSHQPITTKKPPKKYIPEQPISLKEEKLIYGKSKLNYPTKQTKHLEIIENTILPTDQALSKSPEGPFRIALPTFNIQTERNQLQSESEKGKKRDIETEIDLRAKFNCPRESEVRFQLFPKICQIDDDCKTWSNEQICCEIFGAKSCVSGIQKPLEETSHTPILGLIPRKCPSRPLAELWWEVKECDTDSDCWPRVCCPDGRHRYCRTSQPELETVPVPVKRSFNYLTEYLECTAPPPQIFDLHPKTCTSTFDCFPNVCCQEAGLRHCRPPKKSVLTMLANVFNVDFVKRLTQNIVIK